MGVNDEAEFPSMPMPFSWEDVVGPDKHIEDTKPAFIPLEQDVINQEQDLIATSQREPEEMPSLATWDPIPLPTAAMPSLDTANLISEDFTVDDQEPMDKLPSRIFDESLDDLEGFQPVGSFEHLSISGGSCRKVEVTGESESSLDTLKELFHGEFNSEGNEEGGSLLTEASLDDHVAPAKPQADEPVSQKPTSLDVMCGRGGESNKHPGNIIFRKQGHLLKPKYQKAGNRTAKREISKQLVAWVTARRGRFMEKSKDGSWGQASVKRSIYKASQLLRTKPRVKRA